MDQFSNSSVIPASDFDLSSEQAAALEAIDEWYCDHNAKQVFILEGPAGSGKTTTTKYIGQELGAGVAYCAFTGKAASVMRRKGCADASTIHALIYRPNITSTCAKKTALPRSALRRPLRISAPTKSRLDLGPGSTPGHQARRRR
jgi:hypothetical protein